MAENVNTTEFQSHSIFSGIVETKSPVLKFLHSKTKSDSSLTRVTIENLKKKCSRESFSSLFYDGVIDARYPCKKLGGQYKEIAHYRKPINETITYYYDKEAKVEYSCHVVEVDYRVFSDHMLIFSITVDNSHLNFDEIAFQNRMIRGVKFYEKNDFTKEYFALFDTLLEMMRWCDKDFNDDLSHSLFAGNKMYNYLLVRLNEEQDKDYGDDMLYDLATESNLGTSSDPSNSRSHTSQYKDMLINTQSISCFNSWKGLVLNDTVCVLMKSSEPNVRYKNWMIEYFEFIYLNVFYIKAYLVQVNKKYQNKNATSSLEQEYLEFDRTFNFRNISYNFLPQLIYDRMRVGMEINDELNQLKEKISTYSEKCERENEKTINRILFFLTFFTITSAINDGVELFACDGAGGYNWWKINLFVVAIVIAIFTWILYYKKRK